MGWGEMEDGTPGDVLDFARLKDILGGQGIRVEGGEADVNVRRRLGSRR